MDTKEVNNLDEALLAATEDETKRSVFYQTFMNSDIYVIATVTGDMQEGEGGYSVRGEDTAVSFHYFQTEDDELVLPVFSSLEHMQQVISEDVDYVVMNTMAILKNIENGATIFLNMGSHPFKRFVQEEIVAICDGSIMEYFPIEK